jgi:hypothetical protein
VAPIGFAFSPPPSTSRDSTVACNDRTTHDATNNHQHIVRMLVDE